MNRKLMILNLVLVAVVVYAGVQWRKQWRESKAREAATLNQPMKPLPTPKYQSLEPQPPVIPANYVDVAQKMLFHKDRNPNVPIELPPPPPPPPPMPALPVYHGMMNIGPDGPMAILSIGTASNQAIHPGEPIGQFKLLSVNSEEIVFEWNGQTVRKNASELSVAARGIAPPQSVEGRTDAPAAAAAPAKPALVGPGEETGRGFKVCNVGDGNADGSVVDGYRKVAYSTPFGQACRWEPVK